MKFLALVPVAVMMFSSVVNAQQSKVVTIEGEAAKKVLEAMSDSAQTEYVQNSINITVLKNGNVTCTLIGSHGGGANASNPSYSCDIQL